MHDGLGWFSAHHADRRREEVKKAKVVVRAAGESAGEVAEKCLYCSDCEGVVRTPEKLPYYGRSVTVCGEGFNPADRCHRFDLLCMEAQRAFIVNNPDKKPVHTDGWVSSAAKVVVNG